MCSKIILSSLLVIFIAKQCLACDANDRGDCMDIMASSLGYKLPSGVYNLFVGGGMRAVSAYCDMDTDGGGWTVIQRRSSAALSFYQNWYSYENGFGNPTGDHWIGLSRMASITNNKRYRLRIEFTDWKDYKHYAEYDSFRIGYAGCNYTLESLGTYCGDCGDSLTPQLGSKYSTYDRDNDAAAGVNCAVTYHGAWWYKACHTSNLNGEYKNGGVHQTYADGLEWYTCNGYNYSYKKTVMMIRPYNF